MASHLKQLDLSYNHPGDNVEMMFSAVAPHLKLCLDHCGEHRLKPGLKKYGADLKLNANTASRRLVLAEGNREVKTTKMVNATAAQTHSEDRFKRSQVFCDEAQTGLCYWEVEWKGTVGIAVAYNTVGRKWDSSSGLGSNDMSWSLLCSTTVHGNTYTALHGTMSTPIKEPHCQKIAVMLDWEGGTLSYYSVSSGKLSLIHTFEAKFTEPLLPGFWFKKGSVTLCDIE
ncbi:stonustoxin subunit beta-like [Stegastes partitus]|uniref:Stonustoxin subunit beta-like n=1 Tax=Stegastes partitus TaxID=144197 RepID=A0A9Y4TZP3_9TELE|nr:PREDICTED: stonustoxin subunit beta-like [Stegastes partitus]